MPKLAGINHLKAVRALEKAGFNIIRQSKHIVMSGSIPVLQ
jgi:predicted RNA binding protein YcfA (HicA-like mRNA interferase family)